MFKAIFFCRNKFLHVSKIYYLSYLLKNGNIKFFLDIKVLYLKSMREIKQMNL